MLLLLLVGATAKVDWTSALIITVLLFFSYTYMIQVVTLQTEYSMYVV
jgi:hypothetical protein